MLAAAAFVVSMIWLLQRVRDRWVAQRTEVINQLHGSFLDEACQSAKDRLISCSAPSDSQRDLLRLLRSPALLAPGIEARGG